MEQFEEIQECPICSNKQLTYLLSCQDHTVSNELFSIQECANCNFRLTSPRPNQKFIGEYYESEDYISHSQTRKGWVNKVYHVARKIALKKKTKIILKHVAKPSVLDYGCGPGVFLAHCKKLNWSVAGLEPDEKSREEAHKIGLEVAPPETIHQIKAGSFKIVTMWHVLEHVPDISKTLMQINRVLGNNGHLFIAVPNHNSWDANHYKGDWAAYDVPRHLWHFGKKHIQLSAETNGFDMVEILPMRLDAFYISILSERYQNKFSGFGFLKGLYSNLNAMLFSKEFSSQIYVLKKK